MADNELNIKSAEQVALELMRVISNFEEENIEIFLKPNPRAYFLTLFHQCIKAGHGPRKMEDILKESEDIIS